MKKILIILLTIILFGCMDKTDERGFYIEGEKIGYHKETKTLYDKNGYDKDGFDKKGWSKSGINKETKTQYDKDGFNQQGWNKDNINKETKTLYDIEGFDVNSWNKDGINKNTGYTFNENGLTKFLIKPFFLGEDVLKKPYDIEYNLSELTKKISFFKINDEFVGTYYISKSYEPILTDLAFNMHLIETTLKLKHPTLEILKSTETQINEFKEKINNIYLDIYILENKDKKINPYLNITFCSLDKIYNIKDVEFLINDEIVKLPIKYTDTLNTLTLNYVGMNFTPSTNIYFNQARIDLTDEVFDILAKLKIDEEISIRVLTDDKDIRFNWINKLICSDDKLYIKGLPAGLGYYYNLKNNK